MNYTRITQRNTTPCSNCDNLWYCYTECADKKYAEQLSTLENMIEQGTLVAVTRCDKCKHLKVINDGKIYARCDQTQFEFLPFGTDTRKHFCAFGEPSIEVESPIPDSSPNDTTALFDACM